MNLSLNSRAIQIGGGVAGLAAFAGTLYMVFKPKGKSDDSKKGLLGLQIATEPPGLKNLGNTCYINSVLQALASLPSIMRFLSKLQETTNLDPTKKETRVIAVLYELIKALNNYGFKSLHPSNLIDILNENTQFSFYHEQQDSHELFLILMETIDNALSGWSMKTVDTLNPKVSRRSPKNPFRGYLSTQMRCQTCSFEYNMKVECFNDISLDIRNKDCFTLENCIDNYFKPEKLEGVYCVNCSIKFYAKNIMKITSQLEAQSRANSNTRNAITITELYEQITMLEKLQSTNNDLDELEEKLNGMKSAMKAKYTDPEIRKLFEYPLYKVKSDMLKYVKLVRLPKIFCIHLKRLVVDGQGYLTKLEKRIEFSEQLDMVNWLEPKMFNTKNVKNKYILTAVVRHYGTARGTDFSAGHYITFRRAWHDSVDEVSIDSKKYIRSLWSYTSDDQTSIVSKEEVLDSPAYMLFYERL